MLGQVGIAEILVVMIYLFLVVYLGWLGYTRTRTAADYLIAGRKIHPFVMAMSYGATFISTSAIVGFGGVAGLFGMSLLWLTFLNIFVGIFIAFVFLPLRRVAWGTVLTPTRFRSCWRGVSTASSFRCLRGW
jgi:SSS family solute:Na+ symporter